MATTYTANALLSKPSTSDRYWDVPLNANADYLDGLASIGRLLVTPTEVPSVTLNVRVTSGSFVRGDGTVGSFPGVAGFAVTASQTTCLWLTDAGVLTAGASFPVTAHVRLASVVAGGTSVQSVIDQRVGPQSTGSGLGFVLKAGDSVLGTFSVATTAGAAAFTVNPNAPAVGFFGAPPAAQAPALAPLVDSTAGTAGTAVVDVGGAFSQAVLDNNFASLTAKVNALIAALKRHGLMSS